MIANVVRASWMNFRRDRAALMLSFVVPIVFFSIFASVFGSRGSGTPKVKMVVVDADGSDRSRRLIEALRAESALTVISSPEKNQPLFTVASAEAYVRAGSAPAALVIPHGFGTTQVRFGGSGNDAPAFRLIADQADPIAEQVVAGLVQKTAMTSLPDLMMGSGIDAVDRYSGGLTTQQKTTLQQQMDALTAQQRTQGNAGSKQRSGIESIVRIEVSDVLGKSQSRSLVAFYAAGIGVMFLLFTATNAGGALLEESESGTLDRVLATRVSLTTLLAGKLVYLWTLGVAQLCVMFLWGAIAFKLELRQHLAGFAIMVAATALACSAFGLVIASLSRSRAQLSAISTLTVLSISAIGGSMFPRFLMPELFQKIGLVLFNSWAIEGFTNIFWRDLPLSSTAIPVAVLTGCSALFFAIARHLTKRWDIA